MSICDGGCDGDATIFLPHGPAPSPVIATRIYPDSPQPVPPVENMIDRQIIKITINGYLYARA